MQAEVNAMELLRGHGVPYVPAVKFSDFTRTRCSGTYFFMEGMPGRSLSSCKHALSEAMLSTVMHEVGQFQRMTTDFHRTRFGLAGDKRQFDTQFELERYMFSNVLRDAARAKVKLGFEPDALLVRLGRDRVCFDEVKAPSLVHLDMWTATSSSTRGIFPA